MDFVRAFFALLGVIGRDQDYALPEQSPGEPFRGILAVTFVIPVLNETKNLANLKATLEKQLLPQGLELAVIISDNGSDQQNLEHERALRIGERHVEVVTGSIKGSVASARRIGVNRAIEKFHAAHPGASSSEHVLVCFDADVRFVHNDYIMTIQETFSNPNAMLAYGHLGFYTSAGSLFKWRWISVLHRHYDRLFLRALFRINRRRIKDFIHPPFDTIAAYRFVLRECAYTDFTSGFRDEDTTAEDIRLMLELRRHLHPSQIVFHPRLHVLVSTREVEGSNGNISPGKLLKYMFHTNIRAKHLPFSLERNLAWFSPQELARPRNASTKDVVASFIREVEESKSLQAFGR